MKIKFGCLILFTIFSYGCISQSTANQFATEEEIQSIYDYAADSNDIVVVTIKLQETEYPGLPKVTLAGDSKSVIFERIGESTELYQTAKDTWIGLYYVGQPYVIGWIADDKKLFGYCSEPFIAEKDKEVFFTPGPTASFEYNLTNPPEPFKVFPATIILPIKCLDRGNVTYSSWGEATIIEQPGIVKIDGIAPGTYQITAMTSDNNQYRMERTPFLYDQREVEIKPGVNRFDAIFPEIDDSFEEGDMEIRGTLYNSEKQPLANKVILLIPYDAINEQLIQSIELYYPEIVTDQNGIFKFSGIKPNTTFEVRHESARLLFPQEVGGVNASLSADLVYNTISMAMDFGETIEEFVIDFSSGDSSKVSELSGDTIVILAWSSWSESCLQALNELNQIAEQHQDITFIALGMDSQRSLWQQTVENAQWNSLTHGWFDRTKNDFVFHNRIPYYIIIDKNQGTLTEGANIDIKTELGI